MEALIILFITGLLSMFIAMLKKPLAVVSIAVVGLLTSIASIIYQMNYPYVWLNYAGLEFDIYSYVYALIALFFGLFIILVGYVNFSKEVEHTGEYISLLLFSLTGVLCMFAFTDLFMFFLGLEIMSIPIYVMAGTKKKDLRSTEASLKYFFTGAFATGLLLFGIAWLYGATGSFSLNEMSEMITTESTGNGLLMVGFLLVLASFLFKIGAAPFHFWGPDVYEGSPNIVTSFMATIVKMAAFVALFKILTFVFKDLKDFWGPLLTIIAILTMLIGNLTALRQITFKRLIAYSSISHVGYALISLISNDSASIMNLWMYLFAYGFSIISLITISIIVDDEEDLLIRYKGLTKRNPFLGLVLIVSLLSLAGVPPLAGFYGKYLIFSSAIVDFPILVMIALANSGIAIYYYLKLIKIAAESLESEDKFEVKPIYSFILGICFLGTLLGGVLTWM